MIEVVKILFVEPSYIVREGLKTVLSRMGIAFRAEEAEEVRDNFQRLLEKHKPQIVFANPDLLTKSWHGNRSAAIFEGVVLIGLMSKESGEADSAHFDFLINTRHPRQEITQALMNILSKNGFISGETDSENISDRETDVLRLVALGFTNNEISDRLFISVHTVMTHRKNITRKLGIKTVSGLTVYAILNKIIEAGEVKGSSL